MDEDSTKYIKILDSPKNNSRRTLEYKYNPSTDLLGIGGYGEVYKVQRMKNSLTQQFYAVKIFDKKVLQNNTDKLYNILNEIKIHRNLIHENICKYEHSFEDKNNIYILMEYCPCGTLLNFMKKRKILEEVEIRFYMFQVLQVLKYFKLKKLIHRDLTLKNIFLKDYKTIKISDFGLAYYEYDIDENNTTICGTPGYYPPESNIGKYNYKTDVFYFGMCIYYLFGGSTQFITSQQSYDFFSNDEFEIEHKLNISEEGYDLLKNLITTEGKRFGLNKIYQHPFFNKGIGLEKENFPDVNKKEYDNELKALSDKLGIKPMVKKKKKKKKKKIESFSSNSNSSNKEYIKHDNINNYSFNENINNEDIKGKKIRNSIKFLDVKKEESDENKFNEENEEEEDDEKNLTNDDIYFENSINLRKMNKIDLSKIIYIVSIYDKMMENCGVGYKLNNNNIGFIFNDESQMTKINNKNNFIFYHKKDYITKIEQNIIIKLPPKNLTKYIMQKINIFPKIEEELKKEKIKYIKNNNIINNINEDIYIQKYQKGNKCLIFLLSNKNIQVNFMDGVNILFNNSPKVLIYFPKEKNSSINIFPLKKEDTFLKINCENHLINHKIKWAINEIKK